MSALPRSVLYAQNFLKSSRLVATVLDQCDIGHDDVVYEIGPGKGVITEQLALRCRRVVAIEKDPYLASTLRQRFAACPNVSVQQGDFLGYPLPSSPYKVVANIPFNVTSAIVARLTSAANPPEVAYLAMQREAARMLLGQPRESLRSVLLKPWFELAVTHYFRREDFVPAPRVEVVMLRLRKRGPPLVCDADRQCFRDFVTYLFTAWRPTLASSLTSLFPHQHLSYLQKDLDFALDIPPTALSFEQWLRLFERFKAARDARAMRLIAGSERTLSRQQALLQKIHRTRRPGKRR